MGHEAREEIGNQLLSGLVGHCKDLDFSLSEIKNLQRILNREVT